MFQAENWAPVPFHFWALVFFVFGTMIGSFLNVIIHRLPRGESIILPPSHCPQCHYSIPWYLNIPLVTWLYLRGKCRNCGAPISIRYFLVELLTGVAFLSCWLAFGERSAWLALVYCLFLGGLIAASFIDWEHLIIPDEITLGGVAVGLLGSFFVPALHGQPAITASLKQGFLGAAIGAGLIYAILRAGKLLFGRQKLTLSSETKIVFGESAVVLPDREIPYEDLFYRRSDAIVLNARTVELVDRGYANARVRLSPKLLQIDEEKLNPEEVAHLEAVAGEILLPREAMGLGDVKFMAAIGAFLGWQGVLFSLMASSIIGSLVGVMLILLGRKGWSSRLPYGPYIALAAALWIFGGKVWAEWIFSR
jgi:leader peptidase (prepilin peptidase) / N-methyltransferase